jgi:hypothetical protein
VDLLLAVLSGEVRAVKAAAAATGVVNVSTTGVVTAGAAVAGNSAADNIFSRIAV